MPKFQNFDNFNFMFDEGKQPLTVTIIENNDGERDQHGDPLPRSKKTYHVDEPIINNTNPNLTYTNTDGGQQSTMSTVWESKAIKGAPRNTIVKDSHGHEFRVVGSLKVSFTGLFYYQLKETGDQS